MLQPPLYGVSDFKTTFCALFAWRLQPLERPGRGAWHTLFSGACGAAKPHHKLQKESFGAAEPPQTHLKKRLCNHCQTMAQAADSFAMDSRCHGGSLLPN